MKQPCEQMVKSSIDLLMEQINGNNEKKQLIFEAELLERDSVKRNLRRTIGVWNCGKFYE